MDRLEVHERIIATEYFLHGGVLDVPKVYDADGHYHAARMGKGFNHATPWEMRGTRIVVETMDRSAHKPWLAALLSEL